MKKTLAIIVVLLTLVTTMLPTSASIVPAEETTNSVSAECTRKEDCVCSINQSIPEVSRLDNIITVIRNDYIIAQWFLCNDILYTSNGTEVCTVPSGTTSNDIYVGQGLSIYVMQQDGFHQYQFSGWNKRSKYNYDIVRYNINSKGYLTSVAFSFGTMPVEKLFTT